MSEPTAQREYPLPVQDAFERLGPPSDEFVGSPSTAGVAIVLGSLALVGGVGGTLFFIYYLVTEGFDDKFIRALSFPVVALFGWYYLRTGLRNRYVRIYICERGLVHLTARTLTLYPWEDITEIHQDKVKDGLDENGIPFMNRSTTFLIKRKDGASLAVDVNVLKRPLTFARRLYQVTRPHDIPWNLYEG